MLREMTREAGDLRGERHQPLHGRGLRIEAEFPHPIGLARSLGPPVDAAREAIEGLRREAERLADLPHRAAAAVADDLRRQRCAIASVPRVEVLDHLLATAMFEVDVDVGRLVPFLADEPLKERLDAIGIDRGDTEAEADHRVGGRPASLAEDAARSRKTHEVVHGEEVAGVVEFGDEGEFMLDALAHAGRYALRMRRRRISLVRPRLDEFAQVCIGRPPHRHDLARVLVAEFVEAEGEAARRDLARAIDRRRHERLESAADRRRQRGESLPHRGIGLHGAIAAPKPIEPHAVERTSDADRGEDILQRPPRDGVPVHVVGGDERHAEMRRQRRELPIAEILARIADLPDRDREPRILVATPRAASRPIMPRKPFRHLDERLIDDPRRHQGDPEARVVLEQIVDEESRPPLAGPAPPQRDQAAKPSIRVARVDMHQHLDESGRTRTMRVQARIVVACGRERVISIELAPRVRSRRGRRAARAGLRRVMRLMALVHSMESMESMKPMRLVGPMRPIRLMQPTSRIGPARHPAAMPHLRSTRPTNVPAPSIARHLQMQPKPRPHHEPDPGTLRRLMRPHDAREARPIRDRDRGRSQRRGTLDQFMRMTRPREEGEVARHLEIDEAMPCRRG